MPTKKITLTKVPVRLIFNSSAKATYGFRKKSLSVLIFCSSKKKFVQFDDPGQRESFKDPSNLFTIPILYENSQNSPTKSVFLFGKDAAEDQRGPVSRLTVEWGAGHNLRTIGEGDSDVYFEYDENDVYAADPPFQGNQGGGIPIPPHKNFLLIRPGEDNVAALSVNNNPDQKKAIVCIFDTDGNFIASMDPNDEAQVNRSVSIDMPVLVLPFIIPTPILNFEVGDPEDDGEVVFEDDE